MYIPISDLPTLKPALLLRLYALCRELEIPMTKFVNGAVEQAVLQAEERLERGGKGSVLEMVGVERPVPATEGGPAVAAGRGKPGASGASAGAEEWTGRGLSGPA